MSTADIAVPRADTDRIGDWADLVSSAFVPLECRGRADGFRTVLNSSTAAHHMSIRYLYRHFEADGTTVARWIKEQRLEGCRRELAEPSLARFSVSAIAARWGMLDPAGFSRSFRALYGESPGAYRIRHLAGSGDDRVLQSPIQTPLVSVNSSIPAGLNSRPEPLAPKPP